ELVAEHQPAHDLAVGEAEEQRARYVPIRNDPSLGIIENAEVLRESKIRTIVVGEARLARNSGGESTPECLFVARFQFPKDAHGPRYSSGGMRTGTTWRPSFRYMRKSSSSVITVSFASSSVMRTSDASASDMGTLA